MTTRCSPDAGSIQSAQPHDLRAERLGQTQSVERRRAQVVDQPADIRGRRPTVRNEARQQRVDLCRIGSNEVPCRLRSQGHACEHRTEAIVKIALQSVPFLIASSDEEDVRPLELVHQLHRSRRDADLTGQVLQQSPVGGTEAPVSLAGAEDQPADAPRLVGELAVASSLRSECP